MEVIALSGTGENADLLSGMFELRARVFGDRMGWSVRIREGREEDEFDTDKTHYIVVVAQGQVLGCARFLDLSGPSMIGSTFSDLVDRPFASFSASCVESSRFCVDTKTMAGWPNSRRREVTAALISSMIAWAALNQYRAIVTVTDVKIERLLRLFGVPFARLGAPQTIEHTTAVAGLVPVTMALAAKVLPPSLGPRLADGATAA